MNSIKIIKKMPLIHCARGPLRCDKCKSAAQEKKKYCLLELFPEGGHIARPMTEIIFDGEKLLCEYDVIKRFETKKGAKKYAMEKGIDLIL